MRCDKSEQNDGNAFFKGDLLVTTARTRLAQRSEFDKLQRLTYEVAPFSTGLCALVRAKLQLQPEYSDGKPYDKSGETRLSLLA